MLKILILYLFLYIHHTNQITILFSITLEIWYHIFFFVTSYVWGLRRTLYTTAKLRLILMGLKMNRWNDSVCILGTIKMNFNTFEVSLFFIASLVRMQVCRWDLNLLQFVLNSLNSIVLRLILVFILGFIFGGNKLMVCLDMLKNEDLKTFIFYGCNF
jgi:hypothetical protein